MYIIEYVIGQKVCSEVVRASTCSNAVRTLMTLLRTRGMPVSLKINIIKRVKQ